MRFGFRISGSRSAAEWISDSESPIRNRQSEIRNDDIVRLTLTVANEDVLPEIADYLVQGGARVYALSPQRISLEELFMRVMEEEE